MLTIYFFRNYLEADYFPSSDKRLNIDFRDSREYTGQLQKLRRDDSNLVFHLNLKPATIKKLRLEVLAYSQGEKENICTFVRISV